MKCSIRIWHDQNCALGKPKREEGEGNYFKIKCNTLAAAAKLLQSCPTLCDPIDGSPPGSPVPGFSRQEHWSGLPFPSPMHESEKWKWSRSVMSDTLAKRAYNKSAGSQPRNTRYCLCVSAGPTPEWGFELRDVMNGKNGIYWKGLAGTQNGFLTPLIYLALAIKKTKKRVSITCFAFFNLLTTFPH